MKKKLLSLALALALCLGLTVPAFAAELKIVKKPVPTVEDYQVTKYSGWGNFHDGLAILYDSVSSSTNPCYIDRTGKVVIPPAEYDNAWDFSDGFAWVEKNGKLIFIDKTGKETATQYDEALYFTEGFAAVKKGSKWGFIDTTGKEVIPFTYDEAKGFYDGLSAAKKGGKWGFVDQAGEAAIDFQYDEAGTFANGLAPVKQNGKYGYIDRTGKLVIPCTFESAGYFSEGLAMVMQNGKFGYIDTTGKVVIPCKYMYAAPFSEGFAAVHADDLRDMWGFIDKTGKEVVPPTTYTEDGAEYFLTGGGETPSFSEGYVVIRRGGDWKDNYEDRWFYFAITVDANVSDWARAQVDSAAANGLMPDGLGDDFTAKITRAEFAALAVKLYEAMGGYEDPAIENNPFSDTSDPVVLRANALGIVKGSGGQFRPDDLVSREEAAVTALGKYEEYSTAEYMENPFLQR